MDRIRILVIGVVLAGGLSLAAVARAEEKANKNPSPSAADEVLYAKDVRPILARHCFRCHGAEKQESGLRLDVRAAAMRGGELGEPAIVPGNSNASLLVRVVAGLDENLTMPPEGERLTSTEIGRLRAWIDQGAHWPEPGGDEAAPRTTDHWSFQPLAAVWPPEVADARIVNPIDAFLLARLRAANLDFSPPAPLSEWVRRLYLDTLGLPPSPEEIALLVGDERPDAVARLVDQALASPRYGERWARHWLDVVRFAETSGFETNVERPTAYHYRDYVIDSFNADKPYDQFIFEQLAGDAVGADAATGFLVGGAYDRVKSPDVGLTLMQRQDELADMLNTTGTAFLGLTVGCARCHNHKFDPITQRDYYALQAVFAGVEHGERPLRVAEKEAQRRLLQEVESQLARAQGELTRLLGVRESVNAKVNEERFPPVEVRHIRFTIRATNNGIEPCLDELEIYAVASEGQTPVNVALATTGATATASGVYPNSELHRLEHIHDGRYGNSRSWISNTHGAGWVQIELAEAATIDRIVWGRDREERYRDRLPTDYVIEGAATPGDWRTLASSADRAPLGESAETIWTKRVAALPKDRRGTVQTLLDEWRKWREERDAL